MEAAKAALETAKAAMEVSGGTKNVGGDVDSEKVIEIAWTFDDGPTVETPNVREKFADKGITALTFFIQRHKLGKKGSSKERRSIKKLKEIQEEGGEIAIHGVHSERDHLSWFPSNKKDSYDDVDKSIEDFKKFYEYLNGKGIRVKFVRFPYGLFTEIVDYLEHEGLENHPQCGKKNNNIPCIVEEEARDIIKNEDTSKKQGKIVLNDYLKVKGAIEAKGCHIWGGGTDANQTPPLTWESESSGDGSREDNITNIISPQRAGKNTPPGKFEKLADSVAKNGELRSLVVLAHDTSPEDVAAIAADLAQMNKYARDKKVKIKIKYVTMSELYRDRVGSEP